MPDTLPALAELESRLGHRFKDAGLLRRALTHKSVGAGNYERLEFLGDAALGFLVARMLFDAFPQASEQRLSLARARLVNGETLAAVARGIGLGAFVVLGAGERNAGGDDRASILADALEAVLGAVVLDGGAGAAEAAVKLLFGERLTTLDETDLKDPKTRLQEYLQGRGLALPEYRVAEVGGEQHARKFAVACRVDALDISAEGHGGSRRDAEKRAAASVLAALGQ